MYYWYTLKKIDPPAFFFLNSKSDLDQEEKFRTFNNFGQKPPMLILNGYGMVTSYALSGMPGIRILTSKDESVCSKSGPI
jgi:hypothetical protein